MSRLPIANPLLDIDGYIDPVNLVNPYSFAASGGGVFDPHAYGTVKYWFKADAITGLSNGDPVSSWIESSGNGYDLATAGSTPPLFRTNILNGLPSVDFSPSGCRLAASSDGSTAQPFSAFIVITPAGSGASQNIVSSSGGAGCVYISSNQYSIYGGSIISDPATSSASGVGSFVFDGGSSIVARNGTVGASGSVGSLGLATHLLLGAYASGGGEQYIGHIHEVLIYTGVLSTGNRESVEDGLGAKYGITITH